jgi:hypothetical protein
MLEKKPERELKVKGKWVKKDYRGRSSWRKDPDSISRVRKLHAIVNLCLRIMIGRSKLSTLIWPFDIIFILFIFYLMIFFGTSKINF